MFSLFFKILFKIPRYIRAIDTLIVGIDKAREDGQITVNEAATIIVQCLNVIGMNNVVLYQSDEPLEAEIGTKEE